MQERPSLSKLWKESKNLRYLLILALNTVLFFSVYRVLLYYAELAENAATTGDVPHEGEEFGYVLEGKISITLGKKRYTCKKGEAFYYPAEKPHSITNKHKGKSKFLWVSTPPNF